MINFSLENWVPKLTNIFFSTKIFLASKKSALNVQMVNFIEWFLAFKLSSCYLVIRTQFFGRLNAHFPIVCSTIIQERTDQDILYNTSLFSTPIQIHPNLPDSWKGYHKLDMYHLNYYSIWLNYTPNQKLADKPNQDMSFLPTTWSLGNYFLIPCWYWHW